MMEPVLVNDGPGIRNGTDGMYLCFTLDTTDADAIVRFVKRFGHQPKEIIKDDMLRLGPVRRASNE